MSDNATVCVLLAIVLMFIAGNAHSCRLQEREMAAKGYCWEAQMPGLTSPQWRPCSAVVKP